MVRSSVTRTRPALSVAVFVASATLRANDEASTPALHSTVRVSMRSGGASGVAVGTTVTEASSMFVTRVPVRTVTPSRSSWRRAEADRSGGYGGSTRSMASIKDDPGIGRIDRPEVPAERVPGDLAERARQLDTGGAAPDQHEGHPRPTPLRVSFPFRGLEGDEDAPPDLGRVLEGLEARRHARPFVVPEVGVAGAGRDDERVVGDGALVRHAGPRGARHRCRWPRPAGPSCCAACAARCAAAGRSRPATGRRSPPGRASAGTGGSCGDRPGSGRPPGRARAGERRTARRSRHRR